MCVKRGHLKDVKDFKGLASVWEQTQECVSLFWRMFVRLSRWAPAWDVVETPRKVTNEAPEEVTTRSLRLGKQMDADSCAVSSTSDLNRKIRRRLFLCSCKCSSGKVFVPVSMTSGGSLREERNNDGCFSQCTVRKGIFCVSPNSAAPQLSGLGLGGSLGRSRFSQTDAGLMPLVQSW